MKYYLEVEFEMDELTDDCGDLLEDIRTEVHDVIGIFSLTENARVKISERNSK